MVKLAYGALLALCGAVLVHISILFLLPKLNLPRVYIELQKLNQLREPLVFSGLEKNFSILGLDPFFRYRACFYDLDEAPFILTSDGKVPFFSAALISEKGNVLFSITDRQTINRTLNVEVRRSAEQQRLSQNVSTETAVDGAVPVFVAETKGYALVRVFVPDGSWEDQATTFLNEISCESSEPEN